VEGWPDGGALNFINADTVLTTFTNSSYRIKPGTDDTETTLGPDYQMIVRALPYGDAAVQGDNVQAYNGSRIADSIKATTAATRLFNDEKGYYLEWKVPLASLAGDIASPDERQIFKVYEWPLFVPMVGMTLPFDADLTDLDEGDGTSGSDTKYLRVGQVGGLFGNAAGKTRRALITNGAFSPTITAIEEVASLPVMEGEGLLRSSYPNPTSGQVAIPFEMPTAGMARLAVYNLLGQEVAVLVDGSLTQGGKVFHMDASRLPAGAYVYRLTTDRGVESRLMTVIR
jgi:hypothetical protein